MARVRDRSWWFLVVVAATIAFFGMTDLASGAASDPGIALAITGQDPEVLRGSQPDAYRAFDFITRSLGLALVVMGASFLIILAIPYRAAAGWAWGAMWLLPAWAAAVPLLYLGYGVAPDQPPAPPMVSGPVIAALSALVLLVDRRRFRSS